MLVLHKKQKYFEKRNCAIIFDSEAIIKNVFNVLLKIKSGEYLFTIQSSDIGVFGWHLAIKVTGDPKFRTGKGRDYRKD